MQIPRSELIRNNHDCIDTSHSAYDATLTELYGVKIDGFLQRVPTLRAFWDLEKTVLHEIRVSGTVLWSSTNVKIPHLHVNKPKTNHVSDFRVSGGPPVALTLTSFAVLK